MTNYFMVGTIHGGWTGDGAREMLADWIEAGEWVLGWHNMESDPSYQKQAPNLDLMEHGDVLVAKQMNNDFRTMLVKAIGIVTEPSTDGHRVGVDWARDLRSAPVTLPSSYRQTLTRVSVQTCVLTPPMQRGERRRGRRAQRGRASPLMLHFQSEELRDHPSLRGTVDARNDIDGGDRHRSAGVSSRFAENLRGMEQALSQ